ncbi:hypothetical protein [Bosea sp. LjRoot237]|uniref:hypothetical protein n=1 Tax=Bosea sp. LjRoot237 TaxID=3342292 RepID=UPI003ECC494C
MILRIKNRYLRALVGWGVVLGFVVLFPFFVIYGAAVDTWNELAFQWSDTKRERRDAWRILTFRRVES